MENKVVDCRAAHDALMSVFDLHSRSFVATRHKTALIMECSASGDCRRSRSRERSPRTDTRSWRSATGKSLFEDWVIREVRWEGNVGI
jgi:hypothetical protein